jgi:5-formyltetrahydrofolate cyclo-ligase
MTENNPITKEMIARINELAHLSKTRQLTASELKEQAELRQQYVNAIKAQVTAQLGNITIVNPDGTTAKPQRKEETGHGHAHQHDCGCKNNGGYGKH